MFMKHDLSGEDLIIIRQHSRDAFEVFRFRRDQCSQRRHPLKSIRWLWESDDSEDGYFGDDLPNLKAPDASRLANCIITYCRDTPSVQSESVARQTGFWSAVYSQATYYERTFLTLHFHFRSSPQVPKVIAISAQQSAWNVKQTLVHFIACQLLELNENKKKQTCSRLMMKGKTLLTQST